MIRPHHLNGPYVETCTVKSDETHVKEREIYLREDDQGFRHWTCDCDIFSRKQWCEHVQDYYLHNGAMGRKDPHFVDTSPAIVVFAHPWLIVPCVLTGPVTSDTNLFKVTAVWIDAHRESRDSFLFGNSESLGYVDPYREGRGSIRRLILEWLPSIRVQAQVHGSTVECMSKFHEEGSSPLDFSHSTVDEPVEEKSRKQMYADIFNILDTGDCVACDTAKYMDV